MGNPITLYNNEVYFIANDGIHGYEIWKTDGTEEGTIILKNIYLENPEEAWAKNGVRDLKKSVIFNNELYFSATSSEDNNGQVWKTDGTEEGTNLVIDYFTSNLQVFNDKFYFSGFPNGNFVSYQFWSSDGTIEGTNLVEDMSAKDYIILNDNLFFTGGTSELGTSLYSYKSDNNLNLTENNLKEFIISPNPFNENLAIINSLNKIIKVDFYNLLGKKVYSVDNNFENISTVNLTSGLYLIKVQINNKVYFKKMIKK